ncbi:hypothetical protein CRUP_031124, partial [Coryphaenoides rupestris]
MVLKRSKATRKRDYARPRLREETSAALRREVDGDGAGVAESPD